MMRMIRSRRLRLQPRDQLRASAPAHNAPLRSRDHRSSAIDARAQFRRAAPRARTPAAAGTSCSPRPSGQTGEGASGIGPARPYQPDPCRARIRKVSIRSSRVWPSAISRHIPRLRPSGQQRVARPPRFAPGPTRRPIVRQAPGQGRRARRQAARRSPPRAALPPALPAAGHDRPSPRRRARPRARAQSAASTSSASESEPPDTATPSACCIAAHARSNASARPAARLAAVVSVYLSPRTSRSKISSS